MLDALQWATASVAQAMLAALGTPFAWQDERLIHAGGFMAQVDLDCTALWPAVVLLAALAVFGSTARVPLRRIGIPAVWCVSVVVLVNQLRLVLVLWAGAHQPAHFAWIHEVVGPLLLVLAGAAVVAMAVRGASGAARGGASGAAWSGANGAAQGGVNGASQGAAAVTLVLATFAAASPTAQAQTLRMATPIVSGDLIAKFRETSEPGRQLAAVLAGQRSVASVAPLAVRLSDELDLPLVLVQVTSGREALLALDRGALARSLQARAAREGNVVRASVLSQRAAPGLPSSELILRLEMRAGAAAQPLEGAAAALAESLAIGGLLRPQPQAAAPANTVDLRYDLDALTHALIAKLQQRADVEYVQANRLLRALSPPAGGASR